MIHKQPALNVSQDILFQVQAPHPNVSSVWTNAPPVSNLQPTVILAPVGTPRKDGTASITTTLNSICNLQEISHHSPLPITVTLNKLFVIRSVRREVTLMWKR